MRWNPQRILLVGLVVAFLAACVSATPPPSPTADDGWGTSTPEAQGMDPELLARMLASIEERSLNINSVVIVRNGFIITEAYWNGFERDKTHPIFSCTKSVISALVGIAIEQGYIEGIDAPVLGFFPEASFADADVRKAAMTLEDLLTMTSGLDWEELGMINAQLSRSADWVGFVLDRPMVAPPGFRFNYCSGCSHILSAIIQQATGLSTLDFARRYLFEPLGISTPSWSSDANDIPIGGWGIQLTPRDMAKLGTLYLQEGSWNGRQVVPAAWVRASVKTQVDTEYEPGYGYQWWTFPESGAYAAQGLGGQIIYVIPDLDIVVVFTAAMPGAGPLLELIETFILPAANWASANIARSF